MTNGDLPTNVFSLRQSEFRVIPGGPWVYWVSNKIIQAFRLFDGMDEIDGTDGHKTANNFRFIRYYWELPNANVINGDWKLSARSFSQVKFGYSYGQLVDWRKAAIFFYKSNPSSSLLSEKLIDFGGVSWSRIVTNEFNARRFGAGYIPDVATPAIYSCNSNKDAFICGILNSKVGNYLLSLLNPTINFALGDIKKLPVPKNDHRAMGSISRKVQKIEHLYLFLYSKDECFPSFIEPPQTEILITPKKEAINSIKDEIDIEIYRLYGLSQSEINEIDFELKSVHSLNPESNPDTQELDSDEAEENAKDTHLGRLSFALGIVLGRFQPGTPGALGSAIYRRTDFAIGSLPEPTEEEFNELVGEPSKFAYIDEQGGRHVFSREVEQALRELALPDGIAVFDPNHPRDLPSLVSKALELMLGQAQAQEVIQQAAGGDLRKFLEKDFFTQHHIKQYRKRPVYWPIQSSKRSYGFVLFHEKIDRNTFYALQQEPYLPTKRRAVQLRLEELSKKVLTAQGAARKPIEKEMDELRQLAEELAQFAKDLEAITRGGYEPETDWIDDGVILRMAPLWSVIPLWKSEPKKYWEELVAGKYDWSHIAMKYWPERVKQACKKNKSYAIAHGHEEWYEGG